MTFDRARIQTTLAGRAQESVYAGTSASINLNGGVALGGAMKIDRQPANGHADLWRRHAVSIFGPTSRSRQNLVGVTLVQTRRTCGTCWLVVPRSC